ncbi:MAG TPA: hypothetical protein VF621_16405, partial [Pyrinomonadaceae bacterium]
MLKRIVAIAFIFVCTSAAWMVLGATVFSRTYDSDQVLEGEVASLWGTRQSQSPPAASAERAEAKTTETVVDGKKRSVTEKVTVTETLPLESSRVDVSLGLDHRQKGLLWYSTYKVGFDGTYVFRNATAQERVTFALKFPAERAIYDDLVFTVNGTPVALTNEKNSATGTAGVKPGEAVTLRVAYRSQGLDEWRYNFGGDVAQVRDFRMRMRTDFKEIDFPENTLSPSEKRETDDGWELGWNYKNLVS